jgi:hypothetical protein
MAEMKFSCPHCGQNVDCDERWSGQQLPCPACRGLMVIPQFQTAATPSAPAPTAAQPRPRPMAPGRSRPSKVSVKKFAAIAGGVIVAGVVFYFALGWADKAQTRFNQKQREMVAKSGGGELGHIANLYVALDKTDPEKMGYMRPMRRPTVPGLEPDMAPEAPPPNPAEKLPILPPEWTLDIAAAKIPDGRVNGNISGTNFVIQAARIDAQGGERVLTLRQGVNPADPAFYIFLNLDLGQTAIGRSWTITTQTKGKGVPSVVKQWQPNPRFAPMQKTFTSGYAMKLELGNPAGGFIPGRIFLSLPDKEQTVLAGLFYIESPASP